MDLKIHGLLGFHHKNTRFYFMVSKNTFRSSLLASLIVHKGHLLRDRSVEPFLEVLERRFAWQCRTLHHQAVESDNVLPLHSHAL